jgi:hypothetical protein
MMPRNNYLYFWDSKAIFYHVGLQYLIDGIIKLLRSSGIDSASLCSLVGRYDNSIPAPIYFSKILALITPPPLNIRITHGPPSYLFVLHCLTFPTFMVLFNPLYNRKPSLSALTKHLACLSRWQGCTRRLTRLDQTPQDYTNIDR